MMYSNDAFELTQQPFRTVKSFLRRASGHQYVECALIGKCGACLRRGEIFAHYYLPTFSLCMECQGIAGVDTDGKLFVDGELKQHVQDLLMVRKSALQAHAYLRLCKQVILTSHCNLMMGCSICHNVTTITYVSDHISQLEYSHQCSRCNRVIVHHIDNFYACVVLVKDLLKSIPDAGKFITPLVYSVMLRNLVM